MDANLYKGESAQRHGIGNAISGERVAIKLCAFASKDANVDMNSRVCGCRM